MMRPLRRNDAGTVEAVVAYDRANMARCDLDEILRRDEQELESSLKASPAPAG